MRRREVEIFGGAAERVHDVESSCGRFYLSLRKVWADRAGAKCGRDDDCFGRSGEGVAAGVFEDAHAIFGRDSRDGFLHIELGVERGRMVAFVGEGGKGKVVPATTRANTGVLRCAQNDNYYRGRRD